MLTFEECFCAAEARALRFLVESYGFRAVERTVTPEDTNWMGGIVRYRSDSNIPGATPQGWTVSLSFAPHRLELGLDISDECGNSFGVEELHAVVSTEPLPRRINSISEMPHDTEAQFIEFNRLAGVLRRSGARFFAGDRSLWVELKAQRELAWRTDEDRRAIGQSEAAFQAKEWQKVVQALEPREDRLSKAAAARLAMARKKLQGAT